MTNGNYNRQQVFFECGAGAIFLHSHNEPPTSRSDYNASQTTAFLCRTLQFVVGGITQGQLAPAHNDGDGWFIPVRTLLDARLFHFLPKVAGHKRKTGRQTSLQTGQGAGEKVCKKESGSGRGAAELRVLMVAGSRSRHRLKTFGSVAINVANEGKRMKINVFVRISMQTRQTTSLETRRRPQEHRAGRKAGVVAA